MLLLLLLRKVREMSSNTYQQIALILLVLCTVSPIESRYDKDRKVDSKSIGTQQTTQQAQLASSQPPISLCRKDRTLSFLCHCTPEDESIKAQKADCWIISPEISRKDPHWLAFNSQTQLQQLKFSVLATGNLSFIPTDILQSLKYLRTINIEYGHIHELNSYAFANLTLLVNISLANNQVKIVGPYAFANHANLQEINLEKNEIYELDRRAFVNLPSLNRLNLDHNRLEVIQDDTFETSNKLSELFLCNNSINKLTRDIFKGLGNLKVLKMSSNKLTFITDTVFAELWSLAELELENNQIEKISERAFDGLNNLKRLNLESNHLKTLERGVFTGAPALIYLNMMKNSLETITYNNILPLMDNLVNNTNSILDITENDLVCDCRLSWLIELKNQTKNDKLKEVLDGVECSMKKLHKDPLHHQKTSRVSHNTIDQPHHVTAEEEPDYYDDEPDGKTYFLTTLLGPSLPCHTEESDATELPLSRESIGFDMSWVKVVTSSSNIVKYSHLLTLLFVVVIFLNNSKLC